MASVSGKAFDFSLLRRVFTFVKPYKKYFWTACVLTVLAAILAPLRPYLVKVILDDFVAPGNLSGLNLMAILFGGLMIFQALVEFAETYITALVGQNVVRDLRTALFRKIMSFRPAFFDKTPVGTLQTRAISDMETIGDIFSEGLVVMLGDLLQLVVILGVMMFTDWRLTLICLASMPFLLVSTRIFQKGIKKSFQEVRTQVAALNTFVQEHLTGMQVVQVFNRETVEMEKFKAINEKHAKANIEGVWYYSIFFPVVELVAALSIGLLIWWGAKGVLAGYSSLGTVVAFLLYINMIFRPIRELADKFNTLQMGMVSSERIFKILDTDEFIENKGTLKPNLVKGKVEFRSVGFSYVPGNPVLKGISFVAEPGQTVALVGSTGSGKTTIINTLNRFYEHENGEILVDEIPVQNYELSFLRSKIAMVPQDVFLFSDSIFNNITLRDHSISLKKVEEAARYIGVHEFIEKLPGGFDFDVKERGGLLSTGQRQLIAFIRAFVFESSILILDEATSSIDSESEVLVQKATEQIRKNRTSIVIAHRLSTIQDADQIIVMDHGLIREKGKHKELLAMDGYYRKLYEIQFRKGISNFA